MKNSQSYFRFYQGLIVLLPVFIILISTNCTKRNNNYYRIKVEYFKDKRDVFTDKRNGIVAFEFLDYFQNDTLILGVNDQRFIKEVLNTNEVTGSALLIEIDSLTNIDEVSLVLNNKNKTVVKCNDKNQLFVVTKKNNILLIKSVTYFMSNR